MAVEKEIFVLLLSALLSTSCLSFTSPTAEADAPLKTITVPDDFRTIQEAVRNATAGDTVFVRAGNYSIPPAYEYGIKIGESVTLKGENPHTTIITTTEKTSEVFGVSYGIVLYDNSEISEFTITGNLQVLGLFGNGRINNNIINLTSNGYQAIDAGSGTISSNIINCVSPEPDSRSRTGTIGIKTTTTANTTISNNIINSFGVGIWVGGLQGQSRVMIFNNTLTNNNVGIEGVAPALLQGNNLVNSTSYALYGMFNTNAAYNWWGTTDAQKISSLITIGKSTNITVSFIPFLTEPNPQAIPIQNGITSPTPTPAVPENPLAAIALTLLAVASSILYIRKTKGKLARVQRNKTVNGRLMPYT